LPTPSDGSTFRFEILRYDAASDAPARFDAFEIHAAHGMSVLQGLLQIQDEQDPSLAFRYACRGAVCGSCAMSINGKLTLACRVQLDRLQTQRIVIEPLPNFEIIRDLVVDMTPFWDKYERVRPWLQAEEARQRDGRMSEQERERFDQYVNCILCGLCYAACPVLKANDQFTGPAALAKLYRFLADPRDQRSPDEVREQDSRQGVWGCHTITRCIDACPKSVRPTDGIRGVRRQLLSQTLKKYLGGAE